MLQIYGIFTVKTKFGRAVLSPVHFLTLLHEIHDKYLFFPNET